MISLSNPHDAGRSSLLINYLLYLSKVFDSPVDVSGVAHGMSVAMTDNMVARALIKGSIQALLSARPKTLAEYHSSSFIFKVFDWHYGRNLQKCNGNCNTE